MRAQQQELLLSIVDIWDSSLSHWRHRPAGFCCISRCTFTDFRTIFTFSSNEFVPACLSASELWESINRVYFLHTLINCCLHLLPPYILTGILHAYPSWLVTHYKRENFLIARMHNKRSAFWLNSWLCYISNSTLCCASMSNFSRIWHGGLLIFFFFFPAFAGQIYKVCLWKYETTFSFFTFHWSGWPRPTLASAFFK